jgi:hypothetical protein
MRVRSPARAVYLHTVQAGSDAHLTPIQGAHGTVSLGIKLPGLKAFISLHPVNGQAKTVELFLHFPICLDGLALN